MKKQAKKKKRSWLRNNILSLIIIFAGVLAALAIVFTPHLQNKDADQYALEEVPSCTGEKEQDFTCWSQRYQGLIRSQSIKAAFDDVKKFAETSSYVKAQCHQITHVMGRAAMEVEDSVGSVYEKGDSYCASGYYHGVIEEVAKIKGKDGFIESVDGICTDIIAKRQYSVYHHNCTHGIGHGLMLITENDLDASISACTKIVDSWSESSCLGGVFMENIIADPASNPTHATTHLRPDEPMYPCTAVAKEYKEPCYLIQTAYALRRTNQDFSRVFVMCAQADTEFADTCWQSLGRDASGNSIQNITETHRLCNLGETTEQKKHCAIGAAKGLVYHFARSAEAIQMCTLFTDATVRDVCASTAYEYERSF